jgi:hypothetical protein
MTPPANTQDAPFPCGMNVTVTPLTAFLFASTTLVTNGIPGDVFIVKEMG